jgi:hypothetical protein
LISSSVMASALLGRFPFPCIFRFFCLLCKVCLDLENSCPLIKLVLYWCLFRCISQHFWTSPSNTKVHTPHHFFFWHQW